MAFNERNLDDYVTVAERIQEFYDKYPHGSLQAANPESPWELALVTGKDKNGEPAAQTFVVYTAAAYRDQDDKRPGIGIAWEIWPGRTPYTRGSEIQNAETSAWGRAIAALGIATSKGIATREEVANRRQEREDGLPTNRDGSLSRSRTTDAEKAAAGVMTAAQHAEHTALQPKRSEVRGKVTRIKPEAPPEDEWQQSIAGGAEDLQDRPGSIGPRQRSAIMAKLTGLSREARLARISAILGGREVASTNDLSYTEAAKVLAGLGD